MSIPRWSSEAVSSKLSLLGCYFSSYSKHSATRDRKLRFITSAVVPLRCAKSVDVTLDVEGCDLKSLGFVTMSKKYKDHMVLPERKSANVQLVGRHPEVYEPCDDSFALVDALLADQTRLIELNPSLCLEVGCGSGYVITSLALMLGNIEGKVDYVATDMNDAAIECTKQTLEAHNVMADVSVTDLVSGLEKRLMGAVDVLMCNPPYVPTDEAEVGMKGITSSWAGGERGRIFIDRMLETVDSLLSSKGWFYLVTVTANNPGEICQIMRRKGFASRIVIQRYTEEESLHVLKFWREVHNNSSNSGGSLSPVTRSLSQRLSRFASLK